MPRKARALSQSIALCDMDAARLRSAMGAEFQLVWRLMRRLGVPASCAGDEAQRVFLIFATKLAQIVPGKERSFLIACATRVAANARRSLRRSSGVEELDTASGELAADSTNQERLLDEKRRRDVLDALLAQLSEEQRLVVVLCEIEGQSSAQVAELLGIPIGTAKSRLRVAKQRLCELASAQVKTESQQHREAGVERRDTVTRSVSSASAAARSVPPGRTPASQRLQKAAGGQCETT